MSKGFIIAIDGPASAGKGTLAPILAHKLNGFNLYTGAMYRALALVCLQKGIDPYDKHALVKLLPEMDISYEKGRILLHNEDISERIKQQDVAQGSSAVATIPEVREVMVKKQQQIGKKERDKGKVVIAEGRDTATKVFPFAEMKIFLTARPEIRTQRRLAQLRQIGDTTITFEALLKEVKERDSQDQERKIDPLVKDPAKYGYFVIDDSDMTEAGTIAVIINELKERKLIID